MTLFAFKVGLVTFWMLWLFMVFLTNVCEELKLLRVVPPYWKFASRNFQAVTDATRRYQAPPWAPHFLFVGVLAWQLGALLLFGRAIGTTWVRGILAMGPVNTPSSRAV